MLFYRGEEGDRNVTVLVNPEYKERKDGGVLFKAGLFTEEMVHDGIVSKDDVTSLGSENDVRISHRG